MHIVIPMSGIGKRFLDAGYQDPKPLIKVDGKPIIEHVVNLFPGESDISFICNETHLRETPMRQVLESITENPRIFSVPPHKKGPVYAVSQIFDHIDDEEEVIVNYCDFGTYWDYNDFLRHTRNRKADGAVPAYRGFHPHMLGSTNYAFMRSKEQWMLEIQEKKPFTNDRMSEFASNGTYYFRKGEYVKKYFTELMDKREDLKGEYYVSMVYNLLVQANLKVSIYEIQHMLQWGTPEDLEIYQEWSDTFRSLALPSQTSVHLKNSINLIPLAGRGQRFKDEGFQLPKPLIPVSGKPMVIQATSFLPHADEYRFISLGEHLDKYPLAQTIKEHYPKSEIFRLDQVTEGQAITCSFGLKDSDKDRSLLIAACDNGMTFNSKRLTSLLENKDYDFIIWTFVNHFSTKSNPNMYGWVDTDSEGHVQKVSVKIPISDTPERDHAIVGTFFIRKVEYFLDALQKMLKDNIRVNNEFYVDSMMNIFLDMGLKGAVFPIDHYIGWGTPNDFRTFEYWQSFFHKNPDHPYNLQSDPYFNQDELSQYINRYTVFKQEYE